MELYNSGKDIEQMKTQLFHQINKTQQCWSDKAQKRFYSEFMKPHKKGIIGFGKSLEQIISMFSKAKKDLENL